MVRLLLITLTFLGISVPAQARMLSSDAVRFREASVRLLGERQPDGRFEGGVEIALSEGFKTYWKQPGDSGVPPSFDFSASRGIFEAQASFPFPQAIDDGAGGKANGYKHAVIFPLSGRADANGIVNLTLDFAVCGQLCLPLNAKLSLDLAQGKHAEGASVAALAKAREGVPKAAAGGTVRITRLATPGAFVLHLPYAGDVARMQAFPDAPAFFEVLSIKPAGSGAVDISVKGQTNPGKDTLGPLSLTYGTPEAAFERVLDVDGAQ